MCRLLILLTLLLPILFSQAVNARGLRFYGNEKEIARRSALIIPDPDSEVAPVEKLSVSFSLRFDNINSPGFICGIKNRTSEDMFCLMYWCYPNNDTVYISFGKEGERELCSVPFKAADISGRLLNITVELDAQTNQTHLSIGDKDISVDDVDLSPLPFRPQLNFGLTRHIVETASIALSDLTVTADGITTRIPLNESAGNAVHDEEGHIAGRAHNPIWLINEAFYWEKLVELKSSTPTGCAYDPDSRQFFSYNNDSLRIFNSDSRFLSSLPLKGKGKFPSLHGMNLFSTSTGKILPYEIYYGNFSGMIDPVSGEWETLNQSPDGKAIHHHAHCLLPNDSSVLLFGGYGNRAYFNHLTEFNLYSHRFDTIPISGDIIAPRFFASMMTTPSADTIYLYGGKGNMEGKQDLGVKYFYDLYLIDLKNRTSKKLWTAQPPKYDRVPARTLIPAADGESFYAMTYPEYRPHSSLQLYRISLADGSETAVGDTIPLISEEIATNVALYNASETGKIFCVVQEFEKEDATTTTIYSIANPPVSKEELSAYLSTSSPRKLSPLGIILICVVVATAIAIIILLRRHRHSKTVRQNTLPAIEPTPAIPSPPTVATDQPSITPPDATEQSSPVPPLTTNYNSSFELPIANRLSLFGQFAVVSPTGHDISHLFSPKLRMLLIYVLIYTLRKGGVSASDLNSVFWPDKEPDKIKNLRNVTIAKLRKSLTDIPDIELTYSNARFTVSVRDGCFCDIARLYQLTNNLTDQYPSSENLAEIMAIICQGKFLQGMENPELDSCKAVVESYTADLLSSAIEQAAANARPEDVAWYCNVLLLIDPLSETAVRHAVKVYNALGRQARARSLYDTFCANYHKIYAQEPPFTFNEIKN